MNCRWPLQEDLTQCVLKPSPENEASGDFHELLLNGREAIEPDAQSLEAMQPCEWALDDLSGLSEVASVRLAAIGNLRGDASSGQWLATGVVVVTAIGLHDDRIG